MAPDDLRLRLRTAELAAAHRRMEEMRGEVSALKEMVTRLKGAREERDALRNSAEYRLGRKLIQPFRKLFGTGRTAEGPARPGRGRSSRISYHQWRLTQLPSAERLREMGEESRGWNARPLMSVIMPVYNTPAAVLEEAVASVRAQAYEGWELIAADDASTEPHVRPLLERLRREDARISVRTLAENGGIAMASNAALSAATGDFVLFLDHDDWLEPDALYETARRIVECGEADFIYSDEDKVDELGYFQQPFFKPDWSPDALLSINYCCHLTAIRRSLVEEVGRFRPGLDGAQDYDLYLRASERARRILHIPRILYHWRISAQSTAHHPAQKPAAMGHGTRALEDAIQRRGLDATVESGLAQASYRVRYRVRSTEKVSILIPAGDGRPERLSRCLETLASHTDWPAYEAIVLDAGSKDRAMRRYLDETMHRVLNIGRPASAAELWNFGVRESGGAWVLFLDSNAEFSDAGWLSALAEHVQRPEVGAAGAEGILLAEGAGDPHFRLPGDLAEDGGLLRMIRNYSAVSAGCMLVRRAVFEEAGGFDEKKFAGALYDIDLCLRMRERKYSIVQTPYAHVRLPSQPAKAPEAETNALRERWGRVLGHDPFNNANLILREAADGV